jgi:predicted nucleic acid-binding protein
LPDPDDERILEVAIEAQAMIITYNKKHFPGVARFAIDVKTPAEFLEILGGKL